MSRLGPADDDDKKDPFSSPNPGKQFKVVYKKLNLTFTQEDLMKILEDPQVQHELQEFEKSFVTPYEETSSPKKYQSWKKAPK
jgi:hypothetical protein